MVRENLSRSYVEHQARAEAERDPDRLDDARTAYERALALDPGQDGARSALRALPALEERLR